MHLASRILIIVAGLMGATGVGLGAAAAHGGFGANLAIASTFLLLHAAPVLAIGLSGRDARLWIASATLLALGALLFAGQLGAGALWGKSLFPLAAPAGGWGMILGWLGLAASAAFPAGIRR